MMVFLAAVLAAILLFAPEPQYISAHPPVPPAELTALPSNTVVSLAAIGDTGANTPFQRDVAAQLLAYHHQQPLDGVLHLGDIIYPQGEIERFGQSHYTKHYQPLWDEGVPFYLSLGNHDVLKGFRPEILSFYKMPARYYTYQVAQGVGSTRVTVDCFALDTNIYKNPGQISWLKKALANSKADWQVVYGHHPLYSSGAHGSHSKLAKAYAPLFKQYGVDLYIAGHEHDYERFKPMAGTLHVVSGGGGAYLRGFSSKHPQSVLRLRAHHFTALQFGKTTAHGQAIDKTGKIIDAFDIPHTPAMVLPAGVAAAS